jgi:hypothetical protein
MATVVIERAPDQDHVSHDEPASSTSLTITMLSDRYAITDPRGERIAEIVVMTPSVTIQEFPALLSEFVYSPILAVAFCDVAPIQANEHPRQFVLDDEIYEITAVLDHWYEPPATYVKVQTTDIKTYLLRHEKVADEWTLQSGFDGNELMSRSAIDVVTIDADAIRRAER